MKTNSERSVADPPQRRAEARVERDDAELTDARLTAEVEALALELRRSMLELDAIGADRNGGEDISTARDELDAIVEVTAEATGSILDACEEIEVHAATMSPGTDREAICAATASIYAACGFQDLTSQRVEKVVGALRRIDRRVSAICSVFGLEQKAADDGLADDASAGDDQLLNGPSLPGEAMTQTEIDRVLDKRA